MLTLLKNGRIYDGTGAPAFRGDILIEDERIARVEPSLSADGAVQVDLEGRSVSSGFFDAHSHNDWLAIQRDSTRYFEPSCPPGTGP